MFLNHHNPIARTKNKQNSQLTTNRREREGERRREREYQKVCTNEKRYLPFSSKCASNDNYIYFWVTEKDYENSFFDSQSVLCTTCCVFQHWTKSHYPTYSTDSQLRGRLSNLFHKHRLSNFLIFEHRTVKWAPPAAVLLLLPNLHPKRLDHIGTFFSVVNKLMKLFSQAIKATGSLVFVSGQLGLDPKVSVHEFIVGINNVSSTDWRIWRSRCWSSNRTG